MRLNRRSLLIGSASGAGVLSLGFAGLGTCHSSETKASPTNRNDDFPKLPIGMNLARVTDWEPGFPFKNLMWGSRPWLSRNLSGSGPHDTKALESFQFDEDGYALQIPIAVPGHSEPQVLFTYLPNSRKAGKYIILFDGEGEFEGLASTKIVSRKPGRWVIHMTHEAGRYEGIIIKRSVAGNHIRNIRIVAEEHEQDDLGDNPFLNEFLEFCEPFHCLRFMDWANTNNSIEEFWKKRKRITFYTMVGVSGDPDSIHKPAPSLFEQRFSGGVAIELMIKLCNILKIDPWFCVPHRATDEYIQQFALLVRDNLDKSLKVYLEYSNEVWNWGFLQSGWMLRSPLAGKLVEYGGGRAWKDEAKSQGTGHPERIGALFRRTFAIWEREWPDHPNRLIRICAVQAAWVDASVRTIKWCMDHGGVDAISPSAYIGPNKELYVRWEEKGADLTAVQVIDDLQWELSNRRKAYSGATIVGFARAHGLKYVAYEGGQHIQPKGQKETPYSDAIAVAQTHPEMYSLYVELLRLHRDMGCELFMHFNSVGHQGSRFGSWGAKKTYATPDSFSPKMRALIDCNEPRHTSKGKEGRRGSIVNS